MSKERELLKTILAYMAAEYLVMTEFEMITQIEDTIKEIQELLAQPEQEQEPVAWCQMVEGKVQDLLTSFEMKDWLYDKSWIPLYTAPPKREPLKIMLVLKLMNKYKVSRIDLIRAVEKAHGIGVNNESI